MHSLGAEPQTILFISPWEFSHFQTCSKLAQALHQRGKKIVICGFADYKERIGKEYDFIQIASKERPINSLIERYEHQSQLSANPALHNLVRHWNSDVLLYLKYLPKALENRKIDLVVFDQAMVGITTLINYLKIPSVEICNALAIVSEEFFLHPVHSAPYPDFTYNPIKVIINFIVGYRMAKVFYTDHISDLNKFRKENGMKRMLFDFQILSNNSKLRIAQLIPELDYPKLMPQSKFSFLGSFSYELPEKIDAPYNLAAIDKPIVYATLGTLQNKNIYILELIDEACKDLDVQLVISLGNHNNESEDDQKMFRKETIVYGFAPQQQLIQQSTMTILHAGLNSTLESLCYGKPMLCIPITHEQPIIAARMKRAKVAEVINLKKLTSHRIKETIQKILSNDSYAEKAKHYGQLLRNAGGIKKAADMIEGLWG